MNCAPITVTAGKAKRDNEGVSLLPRDDSYPELFVGNLADINSCKSTPSTDPEYPDPGTNVEKLGASPSFASISGSGCVPKGLKETSGSLPTATAGNSGGAAAGSSQVASASATPSSAAGQESSSSAAGSPSGGVFATTGGGGAAGSAASPTTLVTSTSPPQASSVYVSPVTPAPIASATSSSDDYSSATESATNSSSASAPASTSAETSAAASATTKPAPSATLSPSGGGSGSGNSTGSDGGSSGTSGKSGACTSEGMFNCIGTKYQQCASGAWTAMQALPGGTTCQQGESENLWARDTTRPNRARVLRWSGKRWVSHAA